MDVKKNQLKGAKEMKFNPSHCYWLPKSKPDTLNRFICQFPTEVGFQVGDLIEITTSIEGSDKNETRSGVYAKVEFKIYNHYEQRFDYWIRPLTEEESKQFNKRFLGDISKLMRYS